MANAVVGIYQAVLTIAGEIGCRRLPLNRVVLGYDLGCRTNLVQLNSISNGLLPMCVKDEAAVAQKNLAGVFSI